LFKYKILTIAVFVFLQKIKDMHSTFEDIVNYRRSVRIFDTDKNIDASIVKKCVELSTLAPNSSNMQLWEFYHITSQTLLDKLAIACLAQNAATTAKQMVVIVVRKDLWKQRVKANLINVKNNIGDKPLADYNKRDKMALAYYKKLIPFLYRDFLGLFGFFKKLISITVGLFKPFYKQTSAADLRVVTHKTAALAAQTFMLAMAAQKYDTCPMEGFDSTLVKKALKLPFGAEINMVISCGKRNTEKGIYGKRFRVPFEEVYKEI
jgi:nitroreductase